MYAQGSALTNQTSTMPKEIGKIQQMMLEAKKPSTKVSYMHETMNRIITFEPTLDDMKAYCKTLTGEARKPYELFTTERNKKRVLLRNETKRKWLVEEKKRRAEAKNLLVDCFDARGMPDWNRIEEIKGLWRTAYGYDAPVETWEEENEIVPETP